MVAYDIIVFALIEKTIHFFINKGGGTMANIKSAKKRILVSKAANERNKNFKSEMKTLIKKADTAVSTNAADKEDAVKAAVKKIDQAVGKGILKKNTAARKKSAFAKKLSTAQ